MKEITTDQRMIEFQLLALETLRGIPFEETTIYKEAIKRLGKEEVTNETI